MGPEVCGFSLQRANLTLFRGYFTVEYPNAFNLALHAKHGLFQSRAAGRLAVIDRLQPASIPIGNIVRVVDAYRAYYFLHWLG